MSLHQHILRDVASVDAPRQHGIHPHLNHLAHRAAMACQQPVDGRCIARLSVGKQFLSVVGVGPHVGQSE